RVTAILYHLPVTRDERFLLVSSAEGELSRWDIATWTRRWQKPSPSPEYGAVRDGSFAWDGRSCVVRYSGGAPLVYATETGETIARFPLSGGAVSSETGALSADGSQAAFLFQKERNEAGSELVLADVKSGEQRRTGVVGFGPVR